ncbi:MAG: AMP-binding protein [Legionellales bacterium]|nr:AMP-binding protein [Legionellales bacterium]
MEMNLISLNNAQKSMISDCLESSNKSVYVTQVKICLRTINDVNLLKFCCLKTIEHYPFLRSFIQFKENDCCLEISPLKNEQVIHHDLRNYSYHQAKITQEKIIEEDLEEGINIENQILARFMLITLKEDEHVLIFTHHHVLLDYQSFKKISIEILDNFIRLTQNREMVFSNTYIQYQTKNHSPTYKQLHFHQAKSLSLPGRIKKSKDVAEHSFHEYKLSSQLTSDINRIASTLKTTPGRLFYLTWGLMLCKYGYSNTATFNIIRDFRSKTIGKKSEVGVFLETFPIQIDYSKNKTARDIAEILNKQILRANDNSICLVENIVDFKKESFQQELVNQFADLVVSADFLSLTSYPLCMEIWTDKKKYYLRFTFDKTQFPNQVIKQLSENIELFFKELCNNHELSVANFCIAKHTIKKKIKKELERFDMVSMMEKNFSAMETKVALRCKNIELTYLELATISNNLMRLIRNQCPDSQLILVCLERSTDLVIAIITAIRLGKTVMPVDSTLPQQRIDKLLLLSNCDLIITDNCNIDRFSQKIAKILNINTKTVYINKSIHPKTKYNADYAIFTSGTTGKPKGVLVQRAGISNTVKSLIKHMKLTCNDNFLSVANFGFDMAIIDIWMPLTLGATLTIATEEERITPETIISLIEKYKINYMGATPAFWQALVDSKLTKPSHKIKILTGGETLPKNLARSLIKIGSLYNIYGPTENSICSTIKTVIDENDITIGKPINNVNYEIRDIFGKSAPCYAIGEIQLSGIGLSPGYLNDHEISHTYLTGDLAFVNDKSDIVFCGRADQQIKISGYRVNKDEVVDEIEKIPGVKKAVLVDTKSNNETYKQVTLTAYIVPKAVTKLSVFKQEIVNHLIEVFPHYMIPTKYAFLSHYPTNQNGKLDMKNLGEFILNDEPIVQNSQDEIIGKIASIWSIILNTKVDKNHNKNFFELGGNSIKTTKLVSLLKTHFDNVDINVVDIYRNPMLFSQASLVASGEKTTSNTIKRDSKMRNETQFAIIGMSCRAPDIESTEDLWDVLSNKRITLSKHQNEHINASNFVSTCGVYANTYYFDNAFFNITNSEARNLDPQHRILLEISYEALDDAGYCVNKPEKTGVFTSCGENYYNYNFPDRVNCFSLNNIKHQLNTSPSFSASHIAYYLNLTGPAIHIDTACSSSLVAITKACQSIKDGESDIAIVAGVSLILPEFSGYLYHKDGIFSETGECRVFDQKSNGAVPSSGAGALILKPLSKAIEDKDNIYGIIKGYSVNNDGNNKASYTAPSVDSQVRCLTDALQNANIKTDEIDYIEAHGTGTYIGDPVELQAICEAYSERQNPVNIGSLKANIGHTNQAAGILGVIKLLLMIKNQSIPPQPSFDSLNKNIKTDLIKIEKERINASINTCAISSFGLGGTNAHVIITRYKDTKAQEYTAKNSYVLIPVSARSENLLEKKIISLRNFLIRIRSESSYDQASFLYNLAYTLQYKKNHCQSRILFVVSTLDQLILQLEEPYDQGKMIYSIPDKKTISLARNWLSGDIVNWKSLRQNPNAKTTHVPICVWDKNKLNIAQDINIKHNKLGDNNALAQEKLIEIWKYYFNENINVTSDFYDLGGDSLMAIEMADSISKFFSIKINPNTLLEKRNIIELSMLIQELEHNSKKQKICFLIRQGTTGKNLFFLPPIGGTSFCYITLSKYISSEYNIYVLNDPDIDSIECQYRSISDMAKFYYDEILRIQPSGKYNLAGLSLGGILSIEIALKLQEQQKTLGFIGLIESWAKVPSELLDMNIFYSIIQHQHDVILKQIENTPYKISKSPWLKVQNARMNQLFLHKQKPFNFPAILFKANETNKYFAPIDEDTNHWSFYTQSNLTIHKCNGNHETILYGEYGKALSILINEYLE